MKEVTKFHDVYSLTNDISNNTIGSLDFFEEYIDFAINSTLSKQMPDLPEEQERYWAGVLLTNYLNGDKNAFTSTFRIRKNINECGQNKVVEMLVKNAIERTSFEQGVLHKLNTENEVEFICEDITNKLSSCKYQEAMDIVKNNHVYQSDLINNYVDFKYRSSIKTEISRVREMVPITSMALSNLENGMQNYGQNGRKSYSGACK